MRGQIKYKFDYYFQYVFNDPKLPDEMIDSLIPGCEIFFLLDEKTTVAR